ncbi:mucin-5AC isoform X2 [Ixodes scapularis]|uniref:mucin-5AC isoform X2 n=1 Tax=Ixodes scapularis TaxID=6945 RepID=UPI001A9F8E2C|nr:mucin-5AC isoform X2 [Ixodes scapularis]
MRCIAVGCKTGRKSGLRIHSFPRDPKRRLEWAVKVNLAENGKLWVPPKESSCYGICEAHFEEDQYEPRRTDRKLKAFAVPTLFEHRRPPRRRRQLRRSTPPPAPVKEPEPKKDARLTAASIAASNDHTYLAPRDQPPLTVRNQGPPKPQPPSVTVTFAMPNSLSSSPMMFTASGTSPFCSLVPATSVCTGGVSSAPTDATSPMLLLQTGGTTSSALPVTTSGAPTSVSNNVVIQGVPAAATNSHGTRPLVSIAPAGSAVRVSAPSSVTVQAASSTGTILPPFNCLPGGGPIILVPVNSLSQRPPGSTPIQGNQVPIIMSVESLRRNTGHTPILKRPPTYEELQAELSKLQSQAASNCQEMGECNKKLIKVKASLAKQTEQLGKFLNMDQVECVQRLPGEKVKWTQKTLAFALEVYSCSPPVYKKLLDSHYPLPPELALKKYCLDSGVKEGVPTELFSLEEVVTEDEDANIVWL